jgi:hypothetical protein
MTQRIIRKLTLLEQPPAPFLWTMAVYVKYCNYEPQQDNDIPFKDKTFFTSIMEYLVFASLQPICQCNVVILLL